MQTIQSGNVLSDIDGMTTKGALMFGMQEVLVASDDDVKKYWVVPGTEPDDDTVVKAGESIGASGRLPKMIMIGAAKYYFPKVIYFNAGDVCRIEANFFGADGKYYIARLCSVIILQDGFSIGRKCMLTSDTVEQQFYVADEFILDGKSAHDIASLYGFREHEIPLDEKDYTLTKWLEVLRINNEIKFLSPYDILIWMESNMDRLTNTLEKRIYLRS